MKSVDELIGVAVDNANSRRAVEAEQKATAIIECIADLQEQQYQLAQRIAELRKQLKELSYAEVTPTSLGL